MKSYDNLRAARGIMFAAIVSLIFWCALLLLLSGCANTPQACDTINMECVTKNSGVIMEVSCHIISVVSGNPMMCY